MSRALKQSMVDYLTTSLQEPDSAVVLNAGAMTVQETEELRTVLRKEGVQVLHLRNRLAKIAFKETGFEGLESVFDGPASLAVGGEGALAISKIVVDHAKKVENLKVIGGFMDGEVLDADGVVQLSKMPGRKELQAMILQAMFGPASDFAGSMDNLLTEVHGLIEALENKGGAGEG